METKRRYTSSHTHLLVCCRVLQESSEVGGKMKMMREKGDIEGVGCRVGYRVGEILSFVYFI
jgi:hypothetical protein